VSRRTDRAAAATGALLLQLGFIAAFIHAFSTQVPPRRLQRELTFFLPRLLPKFAPVTEAPRAPSASPSLPILVPPLLPLRPAPPIAGAPPAGLQNFGRALFGCAPETYASLTPQQRALCPPPGQSMTIPQTPNPSSHTKDEAHWKEELRRQHAPVLLFAPGGAYAAETHTNSADARDHERETWSDCPQISNVPCLNKSVIMSATIGGSK
jgi:hypothetical protein